MFVLVVAPDEEGWFVSRVWCLVLLVVELIPRDILLEPRIPAKPVDDIVDREFTTFSIEFDTHYDTCVLEERLSCRLPLVQSLVTILHTGQFVEVLDRRDVHLFEV